VKFYNSIQFCNSAQLPTRVCTHVNHGSKDYNLLNGPNMVQKNG